MDVDTPTLASISDVVEKAREELASAISALTQVLAAVATSDNTKTKLQTNGPSTDGGAAKTEPQTKRSLEPVLNKFQTLRKTVEQVVSMHTSFVTNAKKEEADISSEERASLTERRTALVAEVRTKNEKVKLLIDQLRDLHRDIVMLLSSYYKPLTTQPR